MFGTLGGIANNAKPAGGAGGVGGGVLSGIKGLGSSILGAANPWMMGLDALGGLFGGGGGASQENLDKGRNDVLGLAGHQGPIGFNTGMGQAGAGGFSWNPEMQQQLGMMGGASQSLMGGGLFNDAGFQQAFQGNDMAGALGQANNAWGQQMGNTAFGGMGGMMNNAGQLQQMQQGMAMGGPQDLSGGMQGQMFGQGLANQQTGLSDTSGGMQGAMFGMGMGNQMAGMQDLSGGMMGGLFGQGMMNQMNAGNQSGLQAQELSAMRANAAPQQNQMFNKLQDRMFAQGRMGTTGGSGDMESFFNAQNQQDLGFQQESFGRGMQQAGFMGNLGGQMMGQGQQFLGQNQQQQNMMQQLGMQQSGLGAGLLGQNIGRQNMMQQLGMQQTGMGAGLMGQNLGQWNQNVAGAQSGLGMMAGLEGQGFNQNLQALQQNQSAGGQRLSAASGLFGQGVDTYANQFGLGLGGMDSMLGFGNLGLQSGRSPWELQAGLLAGSGTHATALSDMASTEVSGGGFMGGMFSDERLKENLYLVGTINGINWYTWDWNNIAREIGAAHQPRVGVIAQEVEAVIPEAVLEVNGYKTVNYERVLGLGA